MERNLPSCRKCQKFRGCAAQLKRLGCNPDDPNNDAIMICAEYRPKKAAIALVEKEG